jgi:hypothetical protein|tara:strand:+ start:679 stop:1587 length:909 start_codon:yes stop_codon:yes gene_type:complete
VSLKKIWLKIFDKDKYRDLKNFERKKINLDNYHSNIYKKILEIRENIERKKELSLIHSGHLGDVIYSLPVIKELSKNHKCNLYIQINKPMPVKYSNHPSGNVYLDKRIVNLFLPLLKCQNFLNSANIYNNENIDVDLDLFRQIPINIRFHSTRWYSHITGIPIDMEKSFLEVKSHDSVKNKIVIVRSPRYRNDFINYKFLSNIKDIICVGLESEFEDLKKEIKNLEYYNCKDFLEMAEIIKASKFFIGNECFAYSIAEGLKVPRLLEASPDFPVIFPVGKNAYDFYHQIHFEMLFKKLYKYK